MIKLYDEDSYITEFDALVCSCEKCSGGFRVLLDRTAFFPEAGGQACDTGELSGQRVLVAEIENDEVFHIVEKPLEPGSTVHGQIFRPERLRKMQHHSAEHIVSGIVKKRLGLENVGFHLGAQEVTMDYSGCISPEELLEIEREANAAVRADLEITARYPSADELLRLDYRSKLELTENVRIVTIGDVDSCACCAPHVKRTGEIGLIKLVGAMRHRGGMRVRMIAAEEALFDYEQKHRAAGEISAALSVKQEEIADGVERLLAEISAQKQKNNALMKAFVDAKLEAAAETDGNICMFLEAADPGALRMLADRGKNKCGGAFAALSGSDSEGYSYVICSKKPLPAEAAKKINAALSGRGGGRDMISGSFAAGRAEICAFFENTRL